MWTPYLGSKLTVHTGTYKALGRASINKLVMAQHSKPVLHPPGSLFWEAPANNPGVPGTLRKNSRSSKKICSESGR